MHKLPYFIRNSYVAIIFIVLEIVAIRSYAYSTPYTQSQLLSTTNSVTRFVQSFFNDIGSYFSLRRENIMLTERLAELENRLDVLEDGSIATDVAPNIFQQYEFMAARVVSNSVNRAENYITLNKGIADGVRINMAVVTPDGYAVGTIVNCSDNFSIARSMLNTSLRVGARLAKDGSIGTIGWNGGDSQIVDFSEVTKYAQVEVGDVVTASGFSHYFPSDIVIGTVESVVLPEHATTYNCRVRLSADMSRLYNVLLIKNNSADEATMLESDPLGQRNNLQNDED